MVNFLELFGIYKDTPENFARIFKKCREDLLIATDLDSELFGNHLVLGTIMELARNGITIKLIYSSEANLKKVPRIKRIIDEGYISARSYDGSSDYFIVGDGWRYRAHGYINDKSFEMARKFRAQFDQIWNLATHKSNLYQESNA